MQITFSIPQFGSFFNASPAFATTMEHSKVGAGFGAILGLYTQAQSGTIKKVPGAMYPLNTKPGLYMRSSIVYAGSSAMYLGSYGLINHSMGELRQKDDLLNPTVASIVSGLLISFPSRRVGVMAGTAAIPTLTLIACHYFTGKKWDDKFDGLF
eukprot:Nk52_evm57s2192 gene=Nk52_evmTU57s2192